MIKKIRVFMRTNPVIRRTVYPAAWYFMNKVLHWRSRLLRVYGLEILQKVQDVSIHESVKCSPYFGTLLGLVREGRLIKHDTDIDFVINPEAKNIKSFYTSLKSIGFIPERILLLNGRMLEFSMSYKIVGVDFFLVGHSADGDRTIFVFDDRGEVRLHTYPQIDRMVDTKTVLGKSIRVPVNAAEHLDNEYGNWRIPNKNWDARRGPSFSGLLDRNRCVVTCVTEQDEIDTYFRAHPNLERIDGGQLEKYLLSK